MITHKGRKHKQVLQIDGDVSCEELCEDLNELDDELELKVVFIDEDKTSAEAELRNYYISEIIPNYSEDINFIEK